MDMDKVNLARLAELALDRQGDHDSLFFEGQWHTSGSLAARATRFAAGLTALGVRPGDRLLVLMANCPEVLITYSAAWRAGAVVTPLIFLVSEDELRHALADSGAVGVVSTAEFLPKVSAAAKGTGVRSWWYPERPRLRTAQLRTAQLRTALSCRCSTSRRWRARRRSRSRTGRAPTWPPCSTPAGPPAGPRGSR